MSQSKWHRQPTTPYTNNNHKISIDSTFQFLTHCDNIHYQTRRPDFQTRRPDSVRRIRKTHGSAVYHDSTNFRFRCFVYPLLMKSGKTLSAQVFLNGVLFCTINGYLQSSYLMFHAEFGKDWSTQINVYLGLLS